MAVNLRHQFFTAQGLREGMAAAGGGSIVNMGSIAWRLGLPGLTHYGTAKAAIVGADQGPGAGARPRPHPGQLHRAGAT